MNNINKETKGKPLEEVLKEMNFVDKPGTISTGTISKTLIEFAENIVKDDDINVLERMEETEIEIEKLLSYTTNIGGVMLQQITEWKQENGESIELIELMDIYKRKLELYEEMKLIISNLAKI